MKRNLVLSIVVVLAALCIVLMAQEAVDLSVVQRIKTEAFDNSKVMDLVFRMADVYGPRLTGSPAFQASGEWAAKQLQEWGIENVKLEKWGPFGKSWSLVRYSGNMVEPQPAPITGFPQPWTPGTNGRITGEAIYASLSQTNDEELKRAMDELKGKLQGKIVLLDAPREMVMQTT